MENVTMMEDELYHRIASVVIYGLVSVIGVLGNGVVIWATGFRMKKTVSTVWYLSLAVADFLVTAILPLAGKFSVITEITGQDGHWPFGRFMCKMEGLVFCTNAGASVLTLVVISVDRCVCVLCPVWARCSGHRTVRKAFWVSLGVWVVVLAQSSTYLVFGDTRSHGDKVICYNNYALVADYDNRTVEEEQLHKFRLSSITITHFITGFVVPFSIIVSCYSLIFYRLRSNHSLASQSGRSFKIIATVIAVFFLCWAPFHIVQLTDVTDVHAQGELSETEHLGLHIARVLALLNSCLNPLLYVFMSQGFKDVFRSRSILKVLEKAFAEEPPQANNSTPTDPGVTRPMTAVSEISDGNTDLPATQDLMKQNSVNWVVPGSIC